MVSAARLQAHSSVGRHWHLDKRTLLSPSNSVYLANFIDGGPVSAAVKLLLALRFQLHFYFHS